MRMGSTVFGRQGSEVRILSLRPIKSNTYIVCLPGVVSFLSRECELNTPDTLRDRRQKFAGVGKAQPNWLGLDLL